MKLPATPRLEFPVHENLLAGQQVASFPARIDHVGQLEQLPEPDHVAAYGYRPLLHADSVAGR